MRWKLVLLSFMVVLFPFRTALADTGPKPSMDFTFQQSGEPVTITGGSMFECDQADCSDAAPLEELGPQGFRCDEQQCSATAYGFADYHKIKVEFSDGKTRESNIFTTAGFDSKYTVSVRPDDLLVEAQFSPTTLFPRTITILLLCVCVVFVGVLAIAFVLMRIRRQSKI